MRILVIILVGMAAAACGSSHTPAAPKTVKLHPGHYRYQLGDQVNVGDKISCVTASGKPAGGGVVPQKAHGVGSSTGFSLDVAADGTVTITCPVTPSVM